MGRPPSRTQLRSSCASLVVFCQTQVGRVSAKWLLGFSKVCIRSVDRQNECKLRYRIRSLLRRWGEIQYVPPRGVLYPWVDSDFCCRRRSITFFRLCYCIVLYCTQDTCARISTFPISQTLNQSYAFIHISCNMIGQSLKPLRLTLKQWPRSEKRMGFVLALLLCFSTATMTSACPLREHSVVHFIDIHITVVG